VKGVMNCARTTAPAAGAQGVRWPTSTHSSNRVPIQTRSTKWRWSRTVQPRGSKGACSCVGEPALRTLQRFEWPVQNP
jgi:hypothetical protein